MIGYRDRSCERPPAQIPACAANAQGCCLGCKRQIAVAARDAECGRLGAIALRGVASAARSWQKRLAAAPQHSVPMPDDVFAERNLSSDLRRSLIEFSERHQTRSRGPPPPSDGRPWTAGCSAASSPTGDLRARRPARHRCRPHQAGHERVAQHMRRQLQPCTTGDTPHREIDRARRQRAAGPRHEEAGLALPDDLPALLDPLVEHRAHERVELRPRDTHHPCPVMPRRALWRVGALARHVLPAQRIVAVVIGSA
jgi:hypothetical protein